MFIIIGSVKGEIFVIGHTTSRKRAERFVEDYPNGKEGEYNWVEMQYSRSL
ncbi:hypothetical protein SEA_YUUY_28 [Microbacterium phage YuuY]|nr:hypothetical protein SEA_YUUY_28 [Microbacterium phage YuuY]